MLTEVSLSADLTVSVDVSIFFPASQYKVWFVGALEFLQRIQFIPYFF